VVNHYDYLREELPRLQHLVDSVASSGEVRHQELIELRQEFRSLRAALERLMLHAEACLFPICEAVEQTGESAEAAQESVDAAIRVDVDEHEAAHHCLRRIRELSREFTPPAELRSSYWVLVDGLTALETELNLHLDAEHCLLFPRGRAAEAQSPAARLQA